jgi:hypothetical protein
MLKTAIEGTDTPDAAKAAARPETSKDKEPSKDKDSLKDKPQEKKA